MPKMSKQGELDFSKLMEGLKLKFQNAVPDKTHQLMLTHGLAGAGIAGLGLGTAAYMREKDKDEDERTSVMLPVLAGVIGGGAAGAGLGFLRSRPGLLPVKGTDRTKIPVNPEAAAKIREAAAYNKKMHDRNPVYMAGNAMANNPYTSTVAIGTPVVAGVREAVNKQKALDKSIRDTHPKYTHEPFKYDRAADMEAGPPAGPAVAEKWHSKQEGANVLAHHNALEQRLKDVKMRPKEQLRTFGKGAKKGLIGGIPSAVLMEVLPRLWARLGTVPEPETP